MRYGFSTLGLLILISFCQIGIAESEYSKKKSEDTSTDFGILSVTEKTKKGSLPLMWRCFYIKDIEIKYKTWPYTDPADPQKILEVMCDFEMFVKTDSVSHVYHGRRGKPESYCHDFKTAWNKLVRDEKYICINGVTITGGRPQKNKKVGQDQVSWTWNKIKTKKGCYGFWDGYACKE